MKHLVLLLALLCSATALARPAYPGLLYATMEDGTRIGYHLVGDEYSHVCITLDGRYIERGQTPSMQTPSIPLKGEDHQADTNSMRTTSMQTPSIPLKGEDPQADDTTVWHYVDAPAQSSPSRGTEGVSSSPLRGIEGVSSRPLRPAQSSPLRGIEGVSSFPTIGEVRGLVLLVEFEDVHFQPEHDQALYQRQLNEEGYSDYGATGSARDYFIAQSGGLFTPQFDVVGPVRLSQPMAYYGKNQMEQDIRPAQMVIDACQYAHDSLSIDFSQYDYDQDGNVDFVFCLYAGYGENYGASPNTIWPHMSYLSSRWQHLTLDGKDVDLYACSCELRGTSGTHIDGIGAVCHEFGHVLGLPDMYDTTYQNYALLGHWDVMDSGSYNNDSRTPSSYTSFERYQLGWLDYIDLTSPQDSVVVPEINASHTAYRIFTASNPDEFFTLENHQQQGWDAAQGGRGLMIIHVSYDASIWRSNAVNSSLYPHYDLMEADGTPGRTYETDLYPIRGNDMFTDYSRPNSLSWKGEPTDAAVTHIQQHDDGNISFEFMNDRLKRPHPLPVSLMTDTSFVAQWNAVEGAIGYRLHLIEELPDSLNPLLLEEDFSLIEDNEPGVNIASSINHYTHQPGWKATEAYPAGGMLRLGALGVSGQLTTPLLTTPHDTLTVSLTCCAYSGKSVNYDVQLLDADEHLLQKQTFKAKRDFQTPVLQFSLPTQATERGFRLSIVSNKERLFIDALRIAQGQIDSLTLWTVGPREWDEVCPATGDEFTDAQATSFAESEGILSLTVTPLIPGRTYTYNVTALDAEPMRNSSPSDDVVVTLPLECGITEVKADAPASPSVIIDLLGRCRTSPSPHGIYIMGGRKLLIVE